MERTCKRCGCAYDGGEYSTLCPDCLATRRGEVLKKNHVAKAIKWAKSRRDAEASAPADMAGALRAAITEKQFVVINKKLAVSITEYLEKQPIQK